MTPKELAAALDGVEYRKEDTRFDASAVKSSGNVIVYGASDDLMEFRGAIYDERLAYEGTTTHVSPDGLLDAPDCDCDAAEELFKIKLSDAASIRAIWGEGDVSWRYETSIPHETFNVMEDGEVYCEGIVFNLASISGEPAQ
jgi:hypothetical protein